MSVIRSCLSRLYAAVLCLSLYASFRICHRFNAKCMILWHRSLAQDWAVLGWPSVCSCARCMCCAYFHFMDSLPRNMWSQPIEHCSLKASTMVSDSWSVGIQAKVGMSPDRYVRIERMRIFWRSGCVPERVRASSNDWVSRFTCRYPGCCWQVR